MKFTLSWLKDHLETTASLAEIAEKLVSLGLEVEGIEDPAEKFNGFVVADVVEMGRHPNADRLSLCYANPGTGERIQVVCGASNVRAGMKVAFAPVGAVIPSTGTALKKGKIRDVESCGMFCSAQELGLAAESEGILDLPTDLPAGTPLATALGMADPIIDVSITPNRSDCFGVRGIARDLAASGLGTLKPLPLKTTPGQFPCPISVTVDDSTACPDFQVRLIRGVRNGQSPDWVQQRLRAVGQRPISALVDVTTYLTNDLGRPLHVFDAAKLQGDLTVRLSKAGETLTALNGKEYTLDDGMTVIADASGVLSLGGILGGDSTACLEETVDVLVECAGFDPIRTAQTGRTLNILSEARTRFERGVDPASTSVGLELATDLILQWCGGSPGESASATHNNPVPKAHAVSITLTQDKLKGLSGCDISLIEAKGFLEALGFSIIALTPTDLTVHVPSYRPDVEGAADLVEEVLRLKGYDNIPPAALPLPKVSSQSPSPVSMAKRVLAARGLNETITWSFMAEDIAQKFGGGDASLRLSNPISIDMAMMRPSLLPNLIQAATRNQDRGQSSVALFEVGPQFEVGALYDQRLMATGVLTGLTGSRHWAQPPRPVDIFDGKAHAFALLSAFGLGESSFQVEASGADYYHPGRKGVIKQGNRTLAAFGEIHPSLITHLNGQGAFVGFEIFLEGLPPLRLKKPVLYLSPYQPVTRDFAFVVDESTPADQVVKAVAKVDRTLISAVTIFDVYQGNKLPENKKSLGIQVRFDPQTGTLTEAQITELCDKIAANVLKTTGGALRTL
jgi:phenylalanyl-tRNA synthetase beta chain